MKWNPQVELLLNYEIVQNTSMENWRNANGLFNFFKLYEELQYEIGIPWLYIDIDCYCKIQA